MQQAVRMATMRAPVAHHLDLDAAPGIHKDLFVDVWRVLSPHADIVTQTLELQAPGYDQQIRKASGVYSMLDFTSTPCGAQRMQKSLSAACKPCSPAEFSLQDMLVCIMTENIIRMRRHNMLTFFSSFLMSVIHLSLSL